MATIEEVLAQVDEIKANTYDDATKIMWLSEVDGQIYNEIILTHKHSDDLEEFNGYSESNIGTELLVPFPYDKLYRDYIFAKIDESNGETDRYANSAAIFNSAYKDFYSWYNKNNLPISKSLKLT